MVLDIRLLPMTAEMYHTYFQAYQNDPDLYADKARFTPFSYDSDWVDRYIRRQIDLMRKCFAIVLGSEMVGELILKNIVPHESATLSICMRRAEYKDRGFGTQAERLAIDYAFYTLDVPVLYADALLTNARSQHVLEKVGFKPFKVEGDFKYYRIDRPRNDMPQ